jgi:hypothetical protein
MAAIFPPNPTVGQQYTDATSNTKFSWTGSYWRGVFQQGNTGDKGDKGEIGVKGDQGIPGTAVAKGDIGPTGNKGDKGDIGVTGAKGETGLSGAASAKGDKGDKGDLPSLLLAGNGLTSNSTHYIVQANTGLLANSTGLFVAGVQSLANTSIDVLTANSLTLNTNTATIGSAVSIVANGNVGIANTTPAHKFSLNGSAYFSTSITTSVVPVIASAINCNTGTYFTKTATGALSWTVTNVPATGAYSFMLELTNGGTGTQTWMTGTKWPGGVAPTLTAAGIDVLGFITDDGGTAWRGVMVMKDSK